MVTYQLKKKQNLGQMKQNYKYLQIWVIKQLNCEGVVKIKINKIYVQRKLSVVSKEKVKKKT